MAGIPGQPLQHFPDHPAVDIENATAFFGQLDEVRRHDG
jgi:hypothetical protein